MSNTQENILEIQRILNSIWPALCKKCNVEKCYQMDCKTSMQFEACRSYCQKALSLLESEPEPGEMSGEKNKWKFECGERRKIRDDSHIAWGYDSESKLIVRIHYNAYDIIDHLATKDRIATKRYDVLNNRLKAERKECEQAVQHEVRTIKALQTELEDWRNKEGSICPEDVGFVEYIKTLTAKIKAKDECIAEIEAMACGEE